mgnify:CR=1 FL=1
MHVVIILLILFHIIILFCDFPGNVQTKAHESIFMELCSPTEGFTVRLTEFRKNFHVSFFAPQFKKIYGIELDLHLTRDGELVVFHDDDLKRVCGRPERPEDLTAAELTNVRFLVRKNISRCFAMCLHS